MKKLLLFSLLMSGVAGSLQATTGGTTQFISCNKTATCTALVGAGSTCVNGKCTCPTTGCS